MVTALESASFSVLPDSVKPSQSGFELWAPCPYCGAIEHYGSMIVPTCTHAWDQLDEQIIRTCYRCKQSWALD